MDFAQNALGLPIFVTNPADGSWIRLYSNVADGTVVQPDGTVVPVAANGNPTDGATPALALAQPAMNVLMQYMVDDAVRARMQNGRITGMAGARRGPAVANFGRTPARVITNAPINYTTKEGMMEYREATKTLYRESEPCFDLSSAGLNAFLGKLGHRARVTGWTIINIVIDVTSGDTRNLLTQYGEIPQEMVKAAVAEMDNQHTRAVQHDEQMYSCIMASLNQDAINLIELKASRYLTPSGENSGLLLLRLVITESTLETKSTINNLWSKLTAGLPMIMETHANNIMKFNTEVRKIQQTLRARGEDASYIVPQLFSVYQACEGSDTPFYRYIEYLENSYNEGAELDSESLMYKAEEKYKEIVERQEWTSGKGKPADIVALETKIEELTEHIKKASGGGGGGNHENQREGERKPRKQKAWSFQRPKEGEPHKKVVDGKDFHWCEGNGAHKPKWVRHEPANCTGKKEGSKTEDKPAEEKKEEKHGGWTAAMKATIQDHEE